jgi:hypothetical protein
MIRGIAAGVVVASLALGLTGCESNLPIPTPSPSDIVGTWHHGADTLTFDADGTFTIADMPLGVVEQSPVPLGGGPTGPKESISGSWVIGSGGTDAGGAPGVQLAFTKPRKVGLDYGLTLIVSDDYPLQLYVFLGRSDSNIRYSFTRAR